VSKAARWGLIGFLVVVFAVVAGISAFIALLTGVGDDDCAPPAPAGGQASTVADTTGLGTVAGYSGAQLVGAAQIHKAAIDSGLGPRAGLIGIIASMGESTLTAVEHGDAAGPDSLGWFQQRNPWAEPGQAGRAQRLDPYQSALLFFNGGSTATDGWEEPGLADKEGWETLALGEAIHRVQGNADPFHYDDYIAPGEAVFAAVSGIDPATLPAPSPNSASEDCEPSTSVRALPAGPGGWVLPAVGRFTSEFGPRWGRNHNGIDIANAVGTPIHAAAGGTAPCDDGKDECATVISAEGGVGGFGQWVRLDHGGGVITVYGHIEAYHVAVGQTVRAGEHIADLGNRGESTGPHLHFEVRVDGAPLDPVPWLQERGVDPTASTS
jgi:hypothetical protein